MDHTIDHNTDHNTDNLNNQHEYYTPYALSAIYDPASLFESAVATLLERVQLVPTTPEQQCVGEFTYQFLTPVVLIFGDFVTEESARELLKKGFQSVVFVARNGLNESQCIKMIKYDELNDFIIESVLAQYLLDYLLVGFGKIIESLLGITPATGRHFVRMLRDAATKTSSVGEFMDDLLDSGYKGFDRLNKLVSDGALKEELGRTQAKIALKSAMYYEIDGIEVVAMNTNAASEDIIDYMRNNNDAQLSNSIDLSASMSPPIHVPKYVIIYQFNKVDDMPGWSLSSFMMDDKFKLSMPEWISILDSKKYLPFLHTSTSI